MTTQLTTRITGGTYATAKNAPLTNSELDGNFISLSTNKLEKDENLADVPNKQSGRDNLDVPSKSGVGATGTWTIGVTGNAATATALQTARTINGVSFNGTANITVTATTPNTVTFGDGIDSTVGSTFDGTSATTISVDTGTGLTIVGGEVQLQEITAGNSLIGAVRYNSNTKTTGQFYGGTTDPSSTTRLNYDGNLHVSNLAASTGISAPTLTATSDINAKTDIRNLENALEIVHALQGKSFRFKWDSENNRSIGLIAQEVETVIPEVVSEFAGHKALAYGNIVAVLIEAIKELSAEVKELRGKIEQ